MSSSGLNETLSEYIRIHKELSDLRKNQTKLKSQKKKITTYKIHHHIKYNNNKPENHPIHN